MFPADCCFLCAQSTSRSNIPYLQLKSIESINIDIDVLSTIKELEEYGVSSFSFVTICN
ncbi:hypothetical protein [endosymbiont 'TC1' of Trimyema compressum]|uniref:hypothetical protein n=1 Tax=endosymbiont 'TC1' of Trimyema compressum TaxID=243899 RepID=UPI00139244EC|nr:hypothetical protein [endosymbiont 'TC1' of Trimyema compressum]